MTLETIHIALASDDRFRIGLLSTVRSIGRNLGSGYKLDINILDCGLSNAAEVADVLSRNALCEASVRIREVPLERFNDLSINRESLSKAAFARMLAPSLLPDLNRVLYLDSDLLVTGDLGKLWKQDLKGKPLGAVPDPHYIFLGEDVANCAEVGAGRFHRYFGSGVLLLDLAQWRKDRTEEALLALGEPGKLVRKFNDQSILNVYFAGRVHFLPRRWNQLRFHWNQSAAFVPRLSGIVHVGGSPKPWHFPAAGATGVNRLYQSVMKGAQIPTDWQPPSTVQHPRPTKKAFFQTLKLSIRSSPFGVFRSVPYVWKASREPQLSPTPTVMLDSKPGEN